MSKFQSTKTFCHSEGFSAAFRQWRATSHCRLIHGYALQFKLTFGAKNLDERNWVVDFGGLKDVKEWLRHWFDHTLVVAQDDPKLLELKRLEQEGLAEVRVMPSVGCEMFARFVYDYLALWVERSYQGRVHLVSVEVSEHGGNSAIVSTEGDI